ncbi:PARP7S [Mytilus coruscus]|uniref:Poly [ADP-ribose] polymerase n=1 Tax=Mytilus coruscus TaxID=42192 RepID=A0A6J8D086_MYTCO|nr:PARP7S [Mytilus coruscus]
MSHKRGSKGGSTGQRKNSTQHSPPGIQTGTNQYAGYNQQPQMPLPPPPPPQYGQAMFPSPNMYSNQHSNQQIQYMYVPVPMPQQQSQQPMLPQYNLPLMAQPMFQPMNQGSILQSGNFNWSGHQDIPPTEHETRDIRKSYGDQGEDHHGSGQIKQAKDDRFKKLKSLLADEPAEHYQSETGPQDNTIEREHRKKGNRGGRRCREENTQENDVEDSGSSEDSETDSDGYDFGSKSNLRDHQSNSYYRGSQKYKRQNIARGGQRKNDNTNSDQSCNIVDSHHGKQCDYQRGRRNGPKRGRGNRHGRNGSRSESMNELNAEEEVILDQQMGGSIDRGRERGTEKRSGDILLEDDQTDNSDGHENYQGDKSHNRLERNDRIQGRRKERYGKVQSERDDTEDNENEIPDVDDIEGNCKESNCLLSHSFRSRHNRRLKDKLGISDFSEADIKIVINCNSPSLCADYIYNNGCKIRNSDKRCPYIHLCQHKIFKRCEDPCKFHKTHSITQFHNQWVLESYHMNGWPEERVLGTIYVPTRQREVSDGYSDDSDLCQVEDGIDDASTYNDSDVNVSSESLSSTASGPVKTSKKLITSAHQSKENIRENDKSNSGRRERFESTENIICGIVGKDDLDISKMSASKIKYDEEEDDNIKEKERIMMQMWEQEEQGISSSDNKKRVKPKSSSRNPSDPDYQEKNPSLLKDETENAKICLFVLKNKCPSSSCKNHHLPSGLPYLWQIKMSKKWVSFSLAEIEIIEKAYCNVQDDVAMEKTGKRYSYHIWFPKMHAKILNVDGQSVSGDDQRCNVRRLSTHSFAEKKIMVDSYLTQWRWYWKDDSDKWTMFDKDVFLFTLERKYQTKQKTFLYIKENFNFMFRIDFLKMTQVNLETDNERQIIRRPLFVSKNDVLQKQFPKSIPFPAAMSTVKPVHFYNWDCAHDFELVELDTTGKEYREVLNSLHDTMDPVRFEFKLIYRIQNRKLWNEYDIKKNHMLADAEQGGNGKTINERNLFHGTDSLNTCRGICTNNFDFRTSGRNATVYGEGSYFAVRSRTSHAYTQADLPTDIRFIFRAKILVWQFTVGNPSLRRPPEIPGQVHKLYDSCVDDVQDPKIFVVFDRNQCYPDYLIMYTDRETPVEKPDAAPNNTENPLNGVDPLVHRNQAGSSTSTTIQRSLQSSPGDAKSSPVVAIARFIEGRKRKDDNCVLG